jgi:hypothetical protein
MQKVLEKSTIPGGNQCTRQKLGWSFSTKKNPPPQKKNSVGLNPCENCYLMFGECFLKMFLLGKGNSKKF